jgi:CubicO group peptidase (beta-lactamase class C family)
MTPSDWLTFGQFILQDGKWKGKQIIRKDMLDELYKPTKANPSYGMSWWLNKDAESSLVGRNVEPGLGDGFRMAAGAGKQRLYILPTQNAVVLRMGKVVDRARGWSDNAFLGAILGQAVPDQRKRPRVRGELRKSMFDPR